LNPAGTPRTAVAKLRENLILMQRARQHQYSTIVKHVVANIYFLALLTKRLDPVVKPLPLIKYPFLNISADKHNFFFSPKIVRLSHHRSRE